MAKNRNTIQRNLVMEAVNRLRSHATADEVYEEVVKVHPGISKGTVYRNLNLLASKGDIRKLSFLGGPDRFDHIRDEHYHARCTECGTVFDVDMPYMPKLDDMIGDKHGFVFSGNDIIFQCICPDCQKKA
ncbi:MAG: transcriptional repressor [Candidatus Ornithospirochaeta sp.]|nr:transcriptional repressor [Candidatus Ornithospirochaeta sp.]